MRSYVLLRTLSIPDGTFGHFIHEDFHLVSCEPEKGKRIPAGTYTVKRDHTGHHQWYRFEAVPGRQNIEIHLGNTEDDSEGCILLGRRRGLVGKKEGVLDSQVAMERLVMYQGEDSFKLEIIERFAEA